MVEHFKTRRAPALEKLLLESGILQKDDAAGEIHEEAGIRYDSATYDQIWGDFCLCWQPPSKPYVVCSCWQYSWIGHCSHHYATEAWIAPTFCRPLLRLLRHNVLAKIKNQEKVLFWPRTIAGSRVFSLFSRNLQKVGSQHLSSPMPHQEVVWGLRQLPDKPLQPPPPNGRESRREHSDDEGLNMHPGKRRWPRLLLLTLLCCSKSSFRCLRCGKRMAIR